MSTALVTRPCVIDGCEGEQYARHLCRYHYELNRRDGTIDEYPRMGPVTTDAPAYRTVHERLYATRGHASGYPCADCGGRARDWAFDDDLTRDGTVQCPISGSHYSADLSRYVPLCRPCHAQRDGRRRWGPVCTIEGCDRKHLACGYCDPHYRRRHRYGSPEFKRLTKAEVATLGLPA